MNERDANIERYDSLKVNDTFGERIAQSLFIGSDPSLLGFSLSYESITFANDMKYIFICLLSLALLLPFRVLMSAPFRTYDA